MVSKLTFKFLDELHLLGNVSIVIQGLSDLLSRILLEQKLGAIS